jgi:hypothetical protein
MANITSMDLTTDRNYVFIIILGKIFHDMKEVISQNIWCLGWIYGKIDAHGTLVSCNPLRLSNFSKN